MIVKKLILKNFKKFSDQEFDFNDDINIMVGDNESGKSTILEALEIGMNYRYRGRPAPGEVSTDLFSRECIQAYIDSNKTQDKLPEILIEIFLEGVPDHKGTNNSLGHNDEGIFVRVCFDENLVSSYTEFTKEPDKVTTLPIELYKMEWMSFAWDRITQHNKKLEALLIDPSRLHPTYGRSQYIGNIIDATLSKGDRYSLNLNFRQLKSTFDDQADVKAINAKLAGDNVVTEKDLSVTVDHSSRSSWENSLQLALDAIPFQQIGKGEQSQIQIKLALHNRSEDVDLVMIEEPENHLSHINLVQLIDYIAERRDGKQLFLTTHSSYVLNKLSFDKICLISDEYVRLKDVDPKTVRTLKRFPGYDTLRAVLAGKIVLVEGPSDELIIKKWCLDSQGKLPEQLGIDVIVVRGIGFKNYLNIIQHLKHQVNVVKDNDGDYMANISNWSSEYTSFPFIKVHSPRNDKLYSLEPALVEENASDQTQLDRYAKIALSAQTYTRYNIGDVETRKNFLCKWFSGESSGRKKVDSAMAIFESTDKIKIPQYLKDAIAFD
jgi:putative ATP-dependent endonuclease of the OLD family